jgi:hypothetical protein
MGALKNFWSRIDAMAEEQRLRIPVWCVWETDAPNAGSALYRCMTREDAVEKFKAEALNGHWDSSVVIHCAPATQKQIDEHVRAEAGWGSPPGPTSPRLKMERV